MKFILIGLAITIGLFLLINYWSKLKDDNKNKIIKSIFGLIVLGFTVLLILLIYWASNYLIPTIHPAVKKSIKSTKKWYLQPIMSDNVSIT